MIGFALWGGEGFVDGFGEGVEGSAFEDIVKGEMADSFHWFLGIVFDIKLFQFIS